jgi:hypothetical protein
MTKVAGFSMSPVAGFLMSFDRGTSSKGSFIEAEFSLFFLAPDARDLIACPSKAG